MDENVKKQFDAFCAEVGMNTSVAINLFAKTVIRERKIPFEIALPNDPFFSETNSERLKAAAERMKNDAGTAHELIE